MTLDTARQEIAANLEYLAEQLTYEDHLGDTSREVSEKLREMAREIAP